MARYSPISPANERRMQICMLATNDLLNDPRVTRHAETLGREGFKVTIVCPLSARTIEVEHRNGYTIQRVQNKFIQRISSIAQRRKLRRVHFASHAVPRIDEIPRKRRRFRSLLVDPLYRRASLVLLQLELMRKARQLRAHVYCANDLDTLLIAILAAGFDRKVVYDAHELWPDMLIGVPEVYRQIFRSLEKLLIRRVARVMTVNELIADVLEARGRLSSPVCSVYNTPAHVRKQDGDRRRIHGRVIVLYQGRYAPERGLEVLVKSSEFLLRDIQLVFRGYGDLEAELRMLARGRTNVRFDPPVPMNALVDAARNADVGVVAYLPTNINNYLASPNKLFEYIQAGLPIAASDSPFMKKIILDNQIGVVFDPADTHSVAAALNMITRKKELDRLRRNLASIASKYSWETESQKLLHIYADLKGTFA